MLKITPITFNDFQENTYLIINDKKECWIVDPGMYYARERDAIVRLLDSLSLKPKGIINTHAHLDHIFGVKFLVDKYQLTFGLHHKEKEVLDYAVTSAAVFGIDFPEAPVPDYFIESGKDLALGDDTVSVLHCPGHSPGSIVFYYAPGQWAIVGDVLFEGSIGRTDLPGGSFDTLITSIREHLFHLPDATIVYPGHGGSTTIGTEKASNPYCRVV